MNHLNKIILECTYVFTGIQGEERDTMYSVLGVLATSLLFITVILLILALRMYRKRGSQKANLEHILEELATDLRRHSQRSHSNPNSVSNASTNHSSPEANPSDNSSNGGCTERSSLSEHTSSTRGTQPVPPRTLPRYGHFANQFPPGLNPSGVPMTMPRQTISAIDEEEVPDMTLQISSTVAVESAEPSISPTAHAGDGTGFHTMRPQLLSNPSQMKRDQSHSTLETSPPSISSDVALSIALYLKHKDCKNKGICYTCRAIEVQFTRLLKHCDPKVVGKMDSCSDIRRKLDLWNKASLSSKTSTEPSSKWYRNPAFKRSNSTASNSKHSLQYRTQRSRPEPASRSLCSFRDYSSNDGSIDTVSHSCPRRYRPQQQRMCHGEDCSHSSLDHCPRHHCLVTKRSRQGAVQNEQVQLSVCRADVSIHDHHRQKSDPERPSSTAGTNQSMSSSTVLPPVVQVETTPL